MVALDDPLRRRGYHIGNVRSGLLDRARLILEEYGLPCLNLRGLAESAGVSIGTVYYHFDSKTALLSELAAFGFWALRAELRKVSRGRRVRNCALIFYDFSRRRPSLYALMFDPKMSRSERVRQNRDAAFEELVAIVQTAKGGDGAEDYAIRAVARAIWTCAHGAAALSITEDSHENMMEEVIDGLELLFRGHVSGPDYEPVPLLPAALRAVG